MSLISVVHEFSVLYSSRVHQRDKRWNDGRVRFFELNNKIEVLSEDMLVVGTDFYPHQARRPLESGVFENGSGYTLPNGRLVLEFNEYLGSFERDLSNIFAKKEASVKSEPGEEVVYNQPLPNMTLSERRVESSEHSSKSLMRGGKELKCASDPKLQPNRRQLGRPIGLRKRAGEAVKTPERPRLISAHKGEKIDLKYFSMVRKDKSIPAGSNKLSRRLKYHTDLFSASKETAFDE